MSAPASARHRAPAPRPATAPPPSAAEVARVRPRLLGIAYRMLGDLHAAEDLVQEALLRWQQADRAAVRRPEAWLAAVVTRLAIDELRLAATRRAAYPGPWLPEPVDLAHLGPAEQAELASDLSLAFLAVLERLAPEERAAFLLREVFGSGYPEIAQVLRRTQVAARQVVHRARLRVRAGRPRFPAPPEAKERLLRQLLRALEDGDREGLLALLAPDASWTSDGGGRVHAARRVVRGADRVARLLLGVRRKFPGWGHGRLAWVNGEPALVHTRAGRVVAVTTCELEDGRALALYRVMNPEKLTRVG